MPLWLLLVVTAIVMALVGVGVKRVADQRSGPEEVTWLEYGVAMTAICIIVLPLVGWAGFSLAKRDVLTYHEFWNGWEARAYVETIACHRDGSCRWTYDCDPYIVQVPYECGDSKNSRTCYRSETRYHSCPYESHEYNYLVDTTLGTYTIDTHRFPENPREHRWGHFRFESLPDYVVSQAGVGEPAFWTRAAKRIADGTPGPVTKVNAYKNYVLASHYTILKRYRKAADEYRAQKLLPAPVAGIADGSFYRAKKVFAVGCAMRDYESWNGALERLNAAFGTELQGDLRLVLVCDPRVTKDPDSYAYALEAHWQDSDLFKRSALPKNTVTVILGTTNGRTVSWSRAFTGMPVGNSVLTTLVRDRFSASQQVAWNPGAILGQVVGRPTYDSRKERYVATSTRTGGVLPDVLWGESMPSSRFTRVSMSGKHNGVGGSGFLYLSTQIEITGLQKFLIVLVASIFAALAFAGVAFNDFFNAKGIKS